MIECIFLYIFLINDAFLNMDIPQLSAHSDKRGIYALRDLNHLMIFTGAYFHAWMLLMLKANVVDISF